ncbi:MAG: MarR family transcriptional regulator [Thermoanaerobaculales bacterium]|jgi:MarR family 2-MHQ and catechol resistance regulon transcriptional repressor|nr:MarR family transcriptional regulator [Thermoanaerobaculales bacterium]
MATRHQGSAAETRALDAYITMRRAVNAVSLLESEVMRAAGLTESQFGALEALHHLGPLCQHELAGKVLKSAGNMTTVVDNLERRGLVERRRGGDDRRVVTVHLTDRGGDLVHEVFPRVVGVLVGAFSALSAKEQEQLGALCRRLGRSRSSTSTTAARQRRNLQGERHV